MALWDSSKLMGVSAVWAANAFNRLMSAQSLPPWPRSRTRLAVRKMMRQRAARPGLAGSKEFKRYRRMIRRDRASFKVFITLTDGPVDYNPGAQGNAHLSVSL